MLKTVHHSERVHSGHSSWPGNCDFTPVFDQSVTIDPSAVSEAWKVLSQDTFAAEFVSLPAIIHRAFKLQLGKRERDDK